MSDDLREDVEGPSRGARPQFGRDFWMPLAVSICITVAVVAGSFIFCGMEYSTLVCKRSLADAWNIVVEKSFGGLVLAGLTWVLGICFEHRTQWKNKIKLEWKKVIKGLWVPVTLFGGVFLVHLFILTPARMYKEKQEGLQRFEGTNQGLLVNIGRWINASNAWNKTESGLRFELKKIGEDNQGFRDKLSDIREARPIKVETVDTKRLDETQKELTAAKEKIRALDANLDPFKQPVRFAWATAKFRVTNNTKSTNSLAISDLAKLQFEKGNFMKYGVLNFSANRIWLDNYGIWNIDFSCEMISGASFVMYLNPHEPVESLLKKPFGFRMYVNFLASEPEIIRDGSIVMFLNGIPMVFEIPPQKESVVFSSFPVGHDSPLPVAMWYFGPDGKVLDRFRDDLEMRLKWGAANRK